MTMTDAEFIADLESPPASKVGCYLNYDDLIRLLLLAKKDAAAQGLVDGRNKCAYSPWKDTAKIAEEVLTVYTSIVAPEPARNP